MAHHISRKRVLCSIQFILNSKHQKYIIALSHGRGLNTFWCKKWTVEGNIVPLWLERWTSEEKREANLIVEGYRNVLEDSRRLFLGLNRLRSRKKTQLNCAEKENTQKFVFSTAEKRHHRWHRRTTYESRCVAAQISLCSSDTTVGIFLWIPKTFTTLGL